MLTEEDNEEYTFTYDSSYVKNRITYVGQYAYLYGNENRRRKFMIATNLYNGIFLFHPIFDTKLFLYT